MEFELNNIKVSLKKDNTLYKDIIKLKRLKETYMSLMAKCNIGYNNLLEGLLIVPLKDYNELWEEYLKDISWIKKKERTSFNIYSKLRDYINTRLSKDNYTLFHITYDNKLLDIENNNSHYMFYFQSVEISNFINDFKDFLKLEIKKLLICIV